MAEEKPKTVKVEALQVHTYNGKEYQVGDTYDIDEQFANSVAIQGKAIRTDRVAVAKQAEKDAAAKPSHPVSPMSTTSTSGRALTTPESKSRK